MPQIPIYKSQGIDNNTAYGSRTTSSNIMNVANAADRLNSRLSGAISKAVQLAAPQITDETVQAALKDVKEGKIDSESVSLVARDVYKKTADSALMADIEVSSGKLAKELENQMLSTGKYSIDNFSKSWDTYSKTTLKGITDPVIKQNISKKLQVLGSKYSGAISTLQVKQQRNIQTKNFKAKLQMDSDSLNNSFRVNDEETLRLQGEINTTLQTMVDSGLIAPNEALLEQKKISKKAYMANLNKGYIDAINTGTIKEFGDKFDKMKHEDIISPLEVSEMRNKILKQSRVHTNNIIKQNTTLVDDAIKTLDSGNTPDNLEDVNNIISTLPNEKQEEFLTAQLAHEEVTKIQGLPIAEQQQRINEMEADKTKDEAEREVLARVKKNFNATKTALKNDPISLSIQQGNIEPTPSLRVGMNIEEYSNVLKERSKNSNTNISIYGKGSGYLFTEAEAAEHSRFLEDPTTPISDKIEFMSAVEQSIPDKSNEVYKQLLKKGASVTTFAGSLVAKGEVQKATKLLKGVTLLKEVPGIVDYDMLNWKLSATLGNVMQFSGEGARESLYKSAAAYYAATAEERGKLDGALSLPDIKSSIIEMTNGIGEKNGQNYFLPKNKTEDDVEDFLDDLTEDDVPKIAGVSKQEVIRIIQDGQLVSFGEGKYAIRNNRQFLSKEDGSVYIMEIK